MSKAMELKVQYLDNYKLDEWGPLVHEPGNACFDLRAAIYKTIYLKGNGIDPIELIPLGVKFEIPDGFCIKIYARSGLGSKGISLVNGVGIIDSDYRGEVKAPMINFSSNMHEINPGDRIVQAMMIPVQKANFMQVYNLRETKRGEGGFGSTGVK